MTSLQQNLSIEPSQLTSKLSSILYLLENESEEIRRFYGSKIKNLQTQIELKDRSTIKLKNRLEKIEKKCQILQWKIVEKDTMIESLNKKIRNIENSFKQKFAGLVEGLDLVLTTQSCPQNWSSKQDQKSVKVQLEKALQSSKDSTKIQTNNLSSSTNSFNSKSFKYSLAIDLDPVERIYQRILKKKLNQSDGMSKLAKIKTFGVGNYCRNFDDIANMSGQSFNNYKRKENENEKQVEKQQSGQRVQLAKKGVLSTNQKNIQNCSIKSPKKKKQVSIETQSKKIQLKNMVTMPILQQNWKTFTL